MYNLLLVDDEADAREALSNYFPWNEVGFRIAGQAGNGKEALDFLMKNDPHIDVVLTDIKMPIMSGIELAEAVYERKQDVQIIFLSSYREFEYAQQALKYRVKNYIVKPAKYQMLLDVFGHLRSELEELHKENPDRDGVVSGEEGLLIARIKAYVRSEYRDATLDNAAQQVHLNANYISSLFKQKTGQNFSDYLLQVKMEVALRLLRDMRYKTYEISDMVGYTNPKNFTRTFKTFYGKTPSEYRNGLNTAP